MKRSILGLIYLIQGMRQAGINVDERLATIGINFESLDTTSIIHQDLESDILNVIAAGIEPSKGLMVGQHYRLVGYGPLLMLLITSTTVGEAIRYGIQYRALSHLSGHLSEIEHQDVYSLCYQPLEPHSEIDQFRAHCEISGTYKFVLDLYAMVGLTPPIFKIELPFPQPKNAEVLNAFRHYYGDDLHFDADMARFSFDSAIARFKIPSADQQTFNIFEQKCIQEMLRLNVNPQYSNSLVQRVHDFLDIQKGQIPSMAETSQALRIPERTLRHQLSQFNSSYKQIREQLIQQKALNMLEYQVYSVEMISEMLGYSEPAAFNHAFKRWFGHSPRQLSK